MKLHTENLFFVAKRSLALALIIALSGMTLFLMMEPAITEAASSDTKNVYVTQVVNSEISVNKSGDITLSTLGGGTNSAIGSSTLTVSTSNSSGYTLKVHATGTPALSDGTNSFNDYPHTTPSTWSVSNDYMFGFTAYGNDTKTGTWGTTDTCGSSGTPDTSMKYSGFDGGNDIQIAKSTGVTGINGEGTTICVATEQDGVYAPSGTYHATIVATATTNP